MVSSTGMHWLWWRGKVSLSRLKRRVWGQAGYPEGSTERQGSGEVQKPALILCPVCCEEGLYSDVEVREGRIDNASAELILVADGSGTHLESLTGCCSVVLLTQGTFSRNPGLFGPVKPSSECSVSAIYYRLMDCVADCFCADANYR